MIELLRRFGGKFRRYMVIGPACKLIEVIFDLLTPLVIAQMIDKGIGAHDVNAVIHYGMLLAAMAVIGISFTLVCQKMAALTSQGMGTDIRGALYQHINKLSYAELDRFGTPSLITRITNDVNQVQLAVALGVRMLIRWPFLAVGSMVAALAIDLKLGMIFLICTPAIGLVFWFVMARCIPYYKQLQAKLDRIALICREGLSGARVVRAFVREDHERERFAQAADDQAHTAIAVGKLSSILNPVTFLVMNLGVCAILWVGGIQVNVGELTQGQVMAFVNYMTQTLTSIVYVANLVVVFTKASASASRINEVLNCVPSITDEGNEPVALPKPSELAGGAVPVPALSLSHVSFSFGAGAANAVNDVTLELPLGKTLGIIGGTGSGKSTLVSLIPRLYDAGTGSVSVELALAAPKGRVYAVECEPDACELIRKNRAKFHACNLILIEGRAPDVLADLPAPDAVFIGGTKGGMEAVVDTVLARNPNARICISAIALETLSAAVAALTAHGLAAEVTQIAVSRTRPAGRLHLLMANNPIFLITGERK